MLEFEAEYIERLLRKMIRVSRVAEVCCTRHGDIIVYESFAALSFLYVALRLDSLEGK